MDQNEDKEVMGELNNYELVAVRLEKKDLEEYCETKIKYFLDLVERLISMKSNLGKILNI